MAKRNRNKYTASINGGTSSGVLTAAAGKKLANNAHQRRSGGSGNGNGELIEVNCRHVATMCGPFSLADKWRLDANRHPVEEECVLDSLYGGGGRMKSSMTCSAAELSRQKLLMSMMNAIDIINSDIPLLSQSQDSGSDLESDAFSTDTELTERAMESPLKTITLAGQKHSSLDDIDQSYIIESITNLLH